MRQTKIAASNIPPRILFKGTKIFTVGLTYPFLSQHHFLSLQRVRDHRHVA